MKTATLFGGAMNIKNSKEYLETIEIGKLLANAGFVVYSGGYGGMMEAVSHGATEAGGKAVGVTCATFGSTVGNSYLTETIVAPDIFDRLRTLITGKDLFIIQRGGIGTLSELFLLLDVIRKSKCPPKVVLIGSCWVPLLQAIMSFTQRNERDLYSYAQDLYDLEQYLKVWSFIK